MPKGCVISDLHMLARRSSAAWHMPMIDQAMTTAETFILNGDIFDFRWSTLPDSEQSIAFARDWIGERLARYSSCKFHYLLGNHDSRQDFVTVLKELEAKNSNLTVHSDFLRLGDKIFIHGDVIHASGNLDRYRANFGHDLPKGGVANLVYDFLTYSRISALHAAAISKGGSARRIVAHLRQQAPEVLAQARHIYFGHTHAPFLNYSFEDWLFHNTGAAIRGMRFQLLEFEY